MMRLPAATDDVRKLPRYQLSSRHPIATRECAIELEDRMVIHMEVPCTLLMIILQYDLYNLRSLPARYTTPYPSLFSLSFILAFSRFHSWSFSFFLLSLSCSLASSSATITGVFCSTNCSHRSRTFKG